MANKFFLERDPSILEDYEPFEINGIDDLIFEYERGRDLESEIEPYIDLAYH